LGNLQAEALDAMDKYPISLGEDGAWILKYAKLM